MACEKRRRTLEDIAGRIKMCFLRDKQSNETNARCHVELFVFLPCIPRRQPLSRASPICLSFGILPSPDLIPPPISPLAALMSRAFPLSSLFRDPHAVTPVLKEKKGRFTVYYCLLSGQMTIAIPFRISHCNTVRRVNRFFNAEYVFLFYFNAL